MTICCETVFNRAFERLEPDDGKLSRPVLRGGGGGNAASLPGAGAARVAMRQDGGDPLYLLGDHLGSTTLVVDKDGNVVSSMLYKPWGKAFT